MKCEYSQQFKFQRKVNHPWQLNINIKMMVVILIPVIHVALSLTCKCGDQPCPRTGPWLTLSKPELQKCIKMY